MRARPFAFIVAVTASVSYCADAVPKTLTAQDVLQHLNQTIAWYQHVNAVDQSSIAPENVLLQDSVRESSKRVVQTAFAFARAQANILAKRANPASGGSAASAESRTLEQAVSQANDRVSNLQGQIDSLDQQIDRASGRKRATLTSERDTLAADLELAKEFQAAVKNFVSFERAPNAGTRGGGLFSQINELENSDSIPRAINTTGKTPSTNTQAFASQAFRAESAGIIALLTRAVSLAGARSQIDSLITETTALRDEVERLKTPLRTVLRGAINEGDTIARTANAQTDPTQLEASRTQLKTLAAQFKEISGVMTPLAEEGIVIGASRAGLLDWRNALDQQYGGTVRYLAIRTGVLGLGIVFLLVLSQLWNRAIIRYVREARRRRQFMLVRRFVIIFAIALVIAFGFFTSISSVATFAGFITAGLAVALQNVIVSVVAYFFLIGRYGLRVGDRVTVSGVTGQVVEIGLVRFFLMEFVGAGSDMHASGRVAAFSNSIIFQPYALLKQAPGTEYVWHAVAATLAPDTEYEAARARLTTAVESVYNRYREAIEQQHAAFERSINVQLTPPKPVSRIHFIDSGYEVFIRYPVEMRHGTDIDEQIIKRVLEETEREPKLKIAPNGSPRIVPAT